MIDDAQYRSDIHDIADSARSAKNLAKAVETVVLFASVIYYAYRFIVYIRHKGTVLKKINFKGGIFTEPAAYVKGSDAVMRNKSRHFFIFLSSLIFSMIHVGILIFFYFYVAYLLGLDAYFSVIVNKWTLTIYPLVLALLEVHEKSSSLSTLKAVVWNNPGIIAVASEHEAKLLGFNSAVEWNMFNSTGMSEVRYKIPSGLKELKDYNDCLSWIKQNVSQSYFPKSNTEKCSVYSEQENIDKTEKILKAGGPVMDVLRRNYLARHPERASTTMPDAEYEQLKIQRDVERRDREIQAIQDELRNLQGNN